jgi:hypothetical protein
VAVHEELCRNDVQALTHIFANTHHHLAAAARRALGLVVVLHPFEVLRQGLALWLTAGVDVDIWGGARHLECGLQRCELGLKVCLIGRHRLFKQLALLGIHAFGLGRELAGLEAAQLKGDAGDLGIPELDGLGLRLDSSALLANVRQHAGGQFGCSGRAQTDKVLGAELVHAWHVCSVQNSRTNKN